MKIKPWMYGAGVVGVGALGIVLYEVMKKPAGALPAGTSASGPTSVTASRPPISPPGTFSQTQPPAGPVVTVSPGTRAVPLKAGDNLTLVLPSGAREWTLIAYGTSSAAADLHSRVDLAGDTTSPVSLTAAQLSGNPFVVVMWHDASGATQAMGITVQKSVVLRP